MKKIILPLLALLGVFLVLTPARAVEVQRVVSPGGIEAWLVEDHTNPILAARIAFRGGASLDPEGKEGLAHMVSALLDEGAGDLDSQTFQGRLDDLSIGLAFSSGRDSFSGSLDTLTENRDEAFRLLRLALTSPRFDKDPVDRIRRQLLVGLKQDEENPRSISGKALTQAIFEGHPYARPSQGTISGIQAITADDLKNFVKNRFDKNSLIVGVTGDITATELAGLLDKTFGTLPDQGSDWRIPEVTPKLETKTVVIRKPVPQSSIIFAQQGLKRDDPDFYTATVLNYILGGGSFTSHLYKEVREKRGLAYSASSNLYPLKFSALILGGAGTANERVHETIEVVKQVWKEMAEKGVTQKELDDAKTHITGSFPLRFSSSGQISDILVGMQAENLGIDYLEKRNSLIDAVTLEMVNDLAKKLIRPDQLYFVVVGDPKGLS